MSSAIPPCESDADAPAWTATDVALLQAAKAHDVTTLRTLLASSSAQIQEPTTLTTPLHAAVSSLSATSSPDDVLAASETVRLLLLNGAIWNDIDAADDTPGCIAFRAGPTTRAVYELIVEAGVRAELLLARFAQLDSDDDDDDDDDGPVDVNPQKYLASKLDYADDKLLDQDSNGVMMAWESEIMLKSVELLLPDDGAKKRRRVLNVGFGMGIVDTAFQRRIGEDGEHYIVEAHPDVLDKMRKDGWMSRKGVTVLEGRWQQALLPLVEDGTTFDAIYFDTFAEPYSALKTFFNELVIALLEPDGGRFGFFHGLGADRRVSWDVYTRVVEIDLLDAGLQTQWTDVDIDIDVDADKGVAADSTWAGVRRKYWDVGAVYRLPICTFLA